MDDGQISAQIGNEEICLIRLSISLCVNSPHSKTQIKVENRPWGGFLLFIQFAFRSVPLALAWNPELEERKRYSNEYSPLVIRRQSQN